MGSNPASHITVSAFLVGFLPFCQRLLDLQTACQIAAYREWTISVRGQTMPLEQRIRNTSFCFFSIPTWRRSTFMYMPVCIWSVTITKVLNLLLSKQFFLIGVLRYARLHGIQRVESVGCSRGGIHCAVCDALHLVHAGEPDLRSRHRHRNYWQVQIYSKSLPLTLSVFLSLIAVFYRMKLKGDFMPEEPAVPFHHVFGDQWETHWLPVDPVFGDPEAVLQYRLCGEVYSSNVWGKNEQNAVLLLWVFCCCIYVHL